MEKSSRTHVSVARNSLVAVWLLLMTFLLLQGQGFGGMRVAVADDPFASYCSDDKYFKGDHDLKASIKAVLGGLLAKTTASGDSDIEFKLQHPADNPRVYGAAFCEKSPPESCAHCLKAAKKQLLHGCDHPAGAEFYSELCYLRFEIYNFIS